jgi:cytochrome b6-f complex iron-sulfur subunit
MSDKETKTHFSRRNFLSVAWIGSLTIILAQAVAATIRFIKPVSKGEFGGLVYAGPLDSFDVNSVNHVLTGRCYISRTDEGIIALWQKCPHLGCAVPWDEKEGQFHCPCHGSTFSVVGDVMGGPAPRAMDYFPVEIINDEVWVDTSDPQSRPHQAPSDMTEV